MAENLLELLTNARPTISIDEIKYDVLTPDDLSIVDHHRLRRWGIRIDDLLQADELDDAAAGELSAMLRQHTDTILRSIPDEIRGKLSDAQRLKVAEVFIGPPKMKAAKRKRKKTPRAHGSKSPRVSKDSSAAIRQSG